MPVHGHGQCSQCGANVEPCCTGASSSDAAAATAVVHAEIEPQLLPHLFDRLGGRCATVTRTALEQAFVARQGCDLDEAREAIDAALRLGMLRESGTIGVRLA